VHLTVRPTKVRVIGFYRHVGFTQLPATDAVVFAMDLCGPWRWPWARRVLAGQSRSRGARRSTIDTGTSRSSLSATTSTR
jgi:hypothetical protein